MGNRRKGAIALGVVLGVGAADCVDASQHMATCPSAAGAPKKCTGGTRMADDGSIDDFEDGDTQLSKIGSRDGYWFIAKDPNGSTIAPSPLAMADQGADGSKKSLHVSGQTSSASGAWGSMVGVGLLSVNKVMYDASRYAGISFKAKIGEGSTKKIRFKIGDVNTHPDGGVCKDCWNHFGKDLPLTTSWQEFKITFAEMRQEPGWGELKGAIDSSQLVSINWSIGPGGLPFDLWIDDLQFFECK